MPLVLTTLTAEHLAAIESGWPVVGPDDDDGQPLPWWEHNPWRAHVDRAYVLEAAIDQMACRLVESSLAMAQALHLAPGDVARHDRACGRRLAALHRLTAQLGDLASGGASAIGGGSCWPCSTRG